MINLKKFKPNLIPKHPKGVPLKKELRNFIIQKNGGIKNYFILPKKNGCRVQLGIMNEPLTEHLTPIENPYASNRFIELNSLCIKLKIALDGEFYAHNTSIEQIEAYFTTNVELPKKIKFWLFDGVVLDRPDLIGYADRMEEIEKRLENCNPESLYLFAQRPSILSSIKDLDNLYEGCIKEGWGGLVLTHYNHSYEFKRTSIKKGTLLKI